MNQRSPRQRDPAHLDFIRQLPCCICGENTTVEAAHLSFACLEVGKPFRGWGKVDDKWTTPLCGAHHRDQHHIGNERQFWDSHGRDPIDLAQRLYACSGDVEAGERVIYRQKVAA